ncbi:MAG: FecR domain-containing protein, partial [Bacteroidetes bacterium]|nr:FecR domain-containing protein [Bacteroidota bacterium]
SRTLYYFVRIAAVIIIVTGIVSVIMLFNQEHPETIVQSQAEKIEHRLPDGSTITLNNNSEIHYKEDYNSTSRTVEISGEAYFEVKPDATRPFIVQAGEASVRALGTSFNVRAMENADEISVNVSTGKVQFYHVEEKTGDTASVTLNPGEKGIFNRMTGMIWKVAVAAPADLFWKTKELIFRRTALSTVLEILDSTYHVTIVLKNEKMKDCPYTSSFKDNKIEEIIETIAETYRLNVIREDKRYVLEGGECE